MVEAAPRVTVTHTPHGQGFPGPLSFGKVPGNNGPPWMLAGVTSRCISVISIDEPRIPACYTAHYTPQTPPPPPPGSARHAAPRGSPEPRDTPLFGEQLRRFRGYRRRTYPARHLQHSEVALGPGWRSALSSLHAPPSACSHWLANSASARHWSTFSPKGTDLLM